MILFAGSWQAAAITSGLIALILYPVLSILEKKSWFGKLFVQKKAGEIRKSMLLLFIMFTVLIAVAWGIFDRPQIAMAAIIMWGTGDAAAAMVGIPFGKHKVHCKLTDGKKSWEGSFAMLFVSFTAGLLVLLISRDTEGTNSLMFAGIGALVGTTAELFSPGEYDTVTVPVLILVTLLII